MERAHFNEIIDAFRRGAPRPARWRYMAESINIAGMAAYLFTMCFSLFVPALAALVLILAFKKSGFAALGLGAATFLVFQVLTRIPAVQLLPAVFPALSALEPGGAAYWAYAAAIALSAGLFEECGRYIVMRFLLKRSRSIWDGVLFGLGHGGFEAFIMVGLNYALMLLMGLYVPDSLPAISYRTVLEGAAASVIFAAGFERAAAVVFHIAMSLVVMRMVVDARRPYWVAVPIAAHAAYNMLAQVLAVTAGVWPTELALAALSVVALAAAIYHWKRAAAGRAGEARG